MATKSLKFLALTATAVIALACAKEPVAGGEGETGVSFSVEVPGIQETKAIGDGTAAKTLYYQAFDKDGAAIEGLGVQSKTLSGAATTVEFQLIKDQTYKFVFWAQTDVDGYYTLDATDGLKKISANYAGKLANDENFDAFYAVRELTVTGPVSETVALTRPFAQINIATAGTISAGTASRDIDFTGATSSVTVKKIPTVFAPLEDKVSTPKDVTFGAADIPAGNITVNGTDYKYLSMNYVFAPADRSVYDITAAVTVESKTTSVSVPGAPLQRNYRTNVVGNLLTTGAGFSVSISSGFAGEEAFDLTNVRSAAELNAAIANGGNINVVGDITGTNRFSLAKNKTTNISIANGVTVTGNLTGTASKVISLFNSGINCTLSGEGTILGPTQESNSPGAAIELEDNSNVLTIDGNLTIKAREGNRRDSNGKALQDVGIMIRAGKVVVNGGHFISSRDVEGVDNPAIYLYSPNGYRSELIINGGTFECESGDAKYLINIDDTTRDHASVKIYGGTFIGFNPADNTAEGAGTNYVAAGYKSVETTYNGKQAWEVVKE